MNEQLKKLDRAVYNVERTIVVTALVVMSMVVFLDVVHRTFAGEGSKLASSIAKIAGMFGRPIPEDGEGYRKLSDAAPYLSAVLAVAIGYFGVRSARRADPIPPPRAIVLAVGGVVVVYGLIRLVVVLMPNGFIWSQPLALVLTLWVGFVGASMCTYENKHLRVEAVQRYLPARIKPLIGFVSGLFTSVVCIALLWLSLRYVTFNYDEYLATDGKGGLFQGMDVPKYLGFLALPFAFLMMTIRFTAKAFAALRGEIDDDPTAGLVAAKSIDSLQSDDDDDARAPSEVETEAVPSTGPRQSEIDTVSSGDKLGPGGKPLPSQISTQPHPVDQLKIGSSPLPRTGGARELQLAPQGAAPRSGQIGTRARDLDPSLGTAETEARPPAEPAKPVPADDDASDRPTPDDVGAPTSDDAPKADDPSLPKSDTLDDIDVAKTKRKEGEP